MTRTSKQVELTSGQCLEITFYGNMMLATKFERDIVEQMVRQLENMDVNEKRAKKGGA